MSAVAAPVGTALDRIPFDEYVRSPEVHATALKDMLVSPKLYRHRMDSPRDDKDALRLGRASHTSVLEPDQFALDFAVWRKKEGRRGTNKHKAFVSANEGRTLLTEAQYNTALRIRDAVRSHPTASELLRSGRPEVTIRWRHERTGLICKSRPDWWGGKLVDLKTTRNPLPAKFSSDAARFGYAMQLAFYVDAIMAASGELLRPVIIAAQNVPPYDVVVYDIPDDVYLHGKEQYERALDLVVECTKSGRWPGIAPDSAVELHLPAWATMDDEEELTMNGAALF